ncbi:MAG: hypothetical protein HY898_18130 [Deltaproteobacteria bacterium]|nr:hypothetical protein [Deltaproteobacteria bacterium]
MADRPVVRFLSLFVPDLQAAREHYSDVLGIEPEAGDDICPAKHPFAAAGPVVFDLETIKIALYQCDMRGTHPGDVGIGLCLQEPPDALAKRAGAAGANVFVPPRTLPGDPRKMAVFMTPDRHFFEVMGPRPSDR